MEMQFLYSKLHDKYTELKMRKESDTEQHSREQELKFMNYVTAAEAMIEHLKTSNEKLQATINELKDHIIPNRSAEEYQYAEYQNLLIEEKQKSKELSEEVERLRSLLQQKSECIDKNEYSIDGQLKSPSRGPQFSSIDLSKGSNGEKTLRPCSAVQAKEVFVSTNASSQEAHVMVKEPERGPGKGTTSGCVVGNNQQIDNCRNTTTSSGDGSNDICLGNCHFQTLVEHLVGMKFSMLDQPEGPCLSILHQSSGYSFSLTWIENAVEKEPELLYHVLSLGTFEKVAPEWMREDLMFSMSMCAVFFKRLSQITRLFC